MSSGVANPVQSLAMRNGLFRKIATSFKALLTHLEKVASFAANFELKTIVELATIFELLKNAEEHAMAKQTP